jgi:hypothetical protein
MSYAFHNLKLVVEPGGANAPRGPPEQSCAFRRPRPGPAHSVRRQCGCRHVRASHRADAASLKAPRRAGDA